jgi:hypothetical protein
LRAQCEANGDLARLLIDEIGDGSINSQAREQQGCGGKERHHFHGESAHGKRRRENVIQRFRVEDGKLRIDGLDLRAHLRRDGGGIDLSAKKEGQIFGRGAGRCRDRPAECRAGKRDRRQSPLDRRSGHLPRRNDLKQTIHSLRNAVTGSIRPARLAGK